MTCENLFVIYAPNLGGNHLANMLSLGKNYAERFDPASYDQKVSTAHFAYISQIDLDGIRTNLDQLTTQSNVFCGHWMEYMLFKQSDLAEYFPNKKFFAIQMPSEGTPGYDRLTRRDPSMNNAWLFNEVTLLYKVPNLATLCNETTSPWYYVWPDLLFDSDINKLFADLKQQGFEIDVDLDLVQDLHTKWVNRL